MNETNNPNPAAETAPTPLPPNGPAVRSGGTRTIQPLASNLSSPEPAPGVNVGTKYQNDDIDDGSGFIDKPISINPRYGDQKKPTFDENDSSNTLSIVISTIVIIIGLFQLLGGVGSLFIQRYEPYGYFFIGLQILIGLGLIFRIETARKVIVFINILVIIILLFLITVVMALPNSHLGAFGSASRWLIASPGIAALIYFAIQTKIISLKSVKRVFR